MKLKHVGMIVVSVLAMSSAAVSAAEGDESVTTTVNGGVIHFKGEVVNAACAIDSESMNQTVELGQVRSSRLAKAGDLSSAVGFNIKLNDCDTNVSSNAAVAFLGTTVTSNDATLKNGDSKTVIVDEITRNAQFPLKARAITVNGNASQGTIEALINVIYTWQ
ncbi:TPA: type 1 fimbrial protein subunit FimA [Escherichia coli O75:H8]|nr:type 1 fimbrial protein subunit FimA [Escherichia coli O75:H8]